MEPPSVELITELQRLGLATERDLARCRARVRQLSQGLPTFDSVWIDALRERKQLTRFQALELEQQRGAQLLLATGAVLQQLLRPDPVLPLFLARHPELGTQALVARYQIPEKLAESTLSNLESYVQANSTPDSGSCYFNRQTGFLEIVHPWIAGELLPRLLVRRGRFPEAVVRAIARGVAEILETLSSSSQFVDSPKPVEAADETATSFTAAGQIDIASQRFHGGHGDLRLSNIWLGINGEVRLLNGGVLATLLPLPTIHTRLPNDAYDALPPERLQHPLIHAQAADQYALGCVLWQLLSGRPPHLTADPLMKIAAHQSTNIPDVRRFAPDTTPELAELLLRMTHRNPLRRPASWSEVLEVVTNRQRGEVASSARIRQFLGSFESAAPRELGQAARDGRLARGATRLTAVALITICLTGFFWMRNEWGLPKLRGIQAASQTASESADAASQFDSRPHQPELDQSTSGTEHSRDTAVGVDLTQPGLPTISDSANWWEVGNPRNSGSRQPGPASGSGSPFGTAPVPDRSTSLAMAATNRGADLTAENVPANAASGGMPVVLAWPAPSADGVIELTERGPYRAESTFLNEPAQQLVWRGNPATPPRVLIPRSGLLVEAEQVRFEHLSIEFELDSSNTPDALPAPAMLIRAQELQLTHCSLYSRENGSSEALLSWEAISPEERDSGRLRLRDCVVQVERPLLASEAPLSFAVLEHVQHRGSGAVLKLQQGVRDGYRVPVILNHCSLLSSGPVIVWADRDAWQGRGVLSLQGEQSIRIPAEAGENGKLWLLGLTGDATEPRSADWAASIQFAFQNLYLHASGNSDTESLIGYQQLSLSAAANPWTAVSVEGIPMQGLLRGTFRTVPAAQNAGEFPLQQVLIEELPLRLSDVDPGCDPDRLRGFLKPL